MSPTHFPCINKLTETSNSNCSRSNHLISIAFHFPSVAALRSATATSSSSSTSTHMTQMWLLWWPKNASAGAKTSTSSATGAVTATSLARKATSSHCNRIAKLLRQLKKRGRVLCSTTGESSGTFQCRYDPLSYSLNFDTSGCGSLLDEHHYQFCAFSSRFASNPGNISHPASDVM